MERPSNISNLENYTYPELVVCFLVELKSRIEDALFFLAQMLLFSFAQATPTIVIEHRSY